MSEEVVETTIGDSSPAEATSAAPDTSAAVETSAPEEKDTTAPQAAAPAWQPNYKFTVKDKEHEFDEWVRPVVKDKTTEEKLRDLYSKAYGIDEVKADRQSLKERYSELEDNHNKISESLKTLGQFVKKGDYRTFFEALQIPRDQVIKYALDEIKYLELPDDEKQRIESEREMQARLGQYEYENMTLKQQQEQLVADQVRRELTFELAKPEVSQVIQAFDARVGRPGAFQQEVIKRGAYYEAVHKTSPPTQQVVNEVIQLLGMQMSAQGQPGMNQQAAAMQSPGVAAAQKPVIPSFNGSGSASPTRKVPTSIEDLRKMRAQLAQQG